MSATEILEELPKLTVEERSEILRRIQLIDGEREDFAVCLAHAEAGFRMLDEMEAEDDARRISR